MFFFSFLTFFYQLDIIIGTRKNSKAKTVLSISDRINYETGNLEMHYERYPIASPWIIPHPRHLLPLEKPAQVISAASAGTRTDRHTSAHNH